MRRWHCHGRPSSLADAGIVQRRRNEPLSGGSDQHRISRPLERIQSDEQRQIMLDAGLGESQTRVDDDPLRGDTGLEHRIDLRHQLVIHVLEHVVFVVRGVGVRRAPPFDPASQPRQCCTMYRQSWSATTCGRSRSSRPPDTSLMICAPHPARPAPRQSVWCRWRRPLRGRSAPSRHRSHGRARPSR